MQRAAAVMCLAALVAAEIPKTEWDEYVKVATDTNWREVVEKEPLILVEFYAPWCGACKQMQPYFDKAAKLLSEGDTVIPLAKVDATANTVAAAKASLKGYPTLKVFRYGEMSDYTGSLSRVDGLSEKIVEFMQGQVGSSSTEITTAKDLKAKFHKKTLDHVAVVGYFSSAGSVDYRIFQQVADRLRGKIAFYHAVNPRVLEDIGYYSKSGAVTVYRPWAGGKQFKAAFKGSLFKKALEEFVIDVSLPPVGYASEDLMPLYQQKGLPLLRAIVSPEKRAELEKGIIEKLQPAQKKHGKSLLFVINEETTDYGHAEDELEVGIIVIEDGKKKFKYDSDEDGDISAWVERFVKKELTPNVKSEKPAGDAPRGEVQVVVGKTFDKYVMDTTKDVLIESYAPWCGHCKRLEPVYKELAKAFAGNDRIVIAKIDATANEVPNSKYKASGFPTIQFASTKDKENPVKYEGARELDEMVKWIKEHATVPVDDEEL